MELLHIRLRTLLTEWNFIVGEAGEAESAAFFHIIMAKVERNLALKYADWLRQKSSDWCLWSLLDWVGND